MRKVAIVLILLIVWHYFINGPMAAQLCKKIESSVSRPSLDLRKWMKYLAPSKSGSANDSPPDASKEVCIDVPDYEAGEDVETDTPPPNPEPEAGSGKQAHAAPAPNPNVPLIIDIDLSTLERGKPATVSAVSAGMAMMPGSSETGAPARVLASNNPTASVPTTANTYRHIELRTGLDVTRGLDYGRFSGWQLLLGRDGQLRQLRLNESSEVRVLDGPFEVATQPELATMLRQEFGPQFRVERTQHFVICHNTDDAFARNAGELSEQIYRAYMLHFTARGLSPTRPLFPLVAIIFDDESQFQNYMARSTGSGPKEIVGFYSEETNRMAYFNAAGREAAKYGNSRRMNITTVLHETTHQLAFNTGGHQRFSDKPLWFAEGLATYFEMPVRAASEIDWRKVGGVNRARLASFQEYRKSRPSDSLQKLIEDDKRFSTDSTLTNAYAEAWALTYYLVNTRPSQYHQYMKLIASKKPVDRDTPEKRIEDFKLGFGVDLRILDAQFLSYMSEVAKKN